jgi:hypothetical protein
MLFASLLSDCIGWDKQFLLMLQFNNNTLTMMVDIIFLKILLKEKKYFAGLKNSYTLAID